MTFRVGRFTVSTAVLSLGVMPFLAVTTTAVLSFNGVYATWVFYAPALGAALALAAILRRRPRFERVFWPFVTMVASYLMIFAIIAWLLVVV